MEKWRKGRYDVDDFIQSTVPNKMVWNDLKDRGWDPDEVDSDKTLKMVCDYFSIIPGEKAYELVSKYVHVRRAKFDSIEAFRNRVVYLRNMLETTLFGELHDEKIHIWAVLKGIEHEHPEVYGRLAGKVKSGLTWSELMEELRHLGVNDGVNEGVNDGA